MICIDNLIGVIDGCDIPGRLLIIIKLFNFVDGIYLGQASRFGRFSEN